MSLAVRVVVESPLLQLDREFDFLVPSELEDEVRFGQRVSFRFGRSKSPQTGFITEVLPNSPYATGSIDSLISPIPVLTEEILTFARQVADRQCVAIGEILQLAIPENMSRTKIDQPVVAQRTEPVKVYREVLLTGPQVDVGGQLFPSWMQFFLGRASEQLLAGNSSLLLVPEQSDVESMAKCAELMNVPAVVWVTRQRSKRFQVFHSLLRSQAVVIGTRSAIYAPVANLGLVAVADDADESYREVGSPHTHLRDLALLRAGDRSSILFAAPYRSVELERLVEIGYLKDITKTSRPVRASFTEPGVRLDESSVNLAKQALREGTLLVLLPRKGVSSAIFCASCGERLKCGCGGFVWEPTEGNFACRLCAKPHIACPACRSNSLRRGRSGSTRTTSEIGKMFAGAKIYEATGDKTLELKSLRNQVVVATPGSAPRLPGGYAGLVILDTDIWLSAQHLRAEQIAIRDWFEAVELLNPEGRVIFSGLGSQLGKPLCLGQLREIARAGYLEAKQLGLPPSVRVAQLSGDKPTVSNCLAALRALGVSVIRNEGQKALIKFDYSMGKSVAAEIRGFAAAAKAIRRGQKNVRGFSVVMDSEVL